jgi:putative nucleotidyltransferase with HDIG domain
MLRDAMARIGELPTLPTVLNSILDALAEPETSALDLGRLIAADQSLSATLLRQANSAYYGFYRTIGSVPNAVVVLGFREVQNLVLTASVFRAFPSQGSAYDRNQLWRHSLATAMLCERLAKALRFSPDATFFSSGLLHDIGKVALDSIYPQAVVEIVARSRDERRPMREIEKEVFGLDHAEIGGVLAEHWNLPPALAEAIRWHHDPESSTSAQQLSRMVAAANHLSYLAGMGETEMGPGIEAPTASLEQLGVTEAITNAVVEEMRGGNARIDALLGAVAAEA